MSVSNGSSVTRAALGLDIGRTKIAGGIVRSDGEILARMTVPAPRSGDNAALTSTLKSIFEELVLEYPDLAAAGVGTADQVQWPDGIVVSDGDDEESQRFDLRAFLAEMTGLPAVVDGDANVAAYAEFRCGAAAQYRQVLLLTIGTGVGGGLILDGLPYHGTTGLAGEVGHMTVSPVGEVCGCGHVGCLEAVASGTALGRNGQRAAALHPASRLARLASGLDRVTGETVWQAALEGDPVALALFEQHGFWLGLGIASLIAILDPQIVVLGGGLVRTGDLLLDPVRRNIERHLFARARRVVPPLVAARFSADAGIVGAAMLALDKFGQDGP